MDAVNPAGEMLRIAEHYRRMTAEELLQLARESFSLADYALQALGSEMRSRGLKLEPEAGSAAPAPANLPAVSGKEPSAEIEPPSASVEDDPYAEERKLVELCKVWGLRDARQVQYLLDRAGIPFFMGPEKATNVDAVTSNLAAGVSVQVMQVGWTWAGQALQSYEPFDQPPPEPEELKEWEELPVRCPRCESAEIVFETLTGGSSGPRTRFRWTCDQCGHIWEDDGFVKK